MSTVSSKVQTVLAARKRWLKTRDAYFQALIVFEAAEKLRLLDEEPHRLVSIRGERVGVLPLGLRPEQAVDGDAQLPDERRNNSHKGQEEKDA